MVTLDYEQMINVRIKKEDLKAIDKIVKTKDELFESRSHFIRCAVRKLIREHK